MTRSALLGSEESARGGLLGRLTVSATDNWWVLLVTGIAWTIISIVIFRFDYSTVAAVGVLFGIIALASAANEMLVAMIATGGWRIVHYVRAGQLLPRVPWIVRPDRGVLDESRPAGLVVARHHRPGRATDRVLGRRLVEPVCGGAGRLGRSRGADARDHRDHRRVPAPRCQPGGADVPPLARSSLTRAARAA